jgi:N-acetylglucosaminyldiphosphoundecaprenol N-acetyl-beta-D-mannosaminyltransferase
MHRNRVSIGDVTVDRVTREEALRAVDALIQAGGGGFVVTPNIDHVVLARRDAAARDVYRRARLSLADGMPLLWMARALGSPLPEKVSGSDLIEPLMRAAAANGRRVFFFGSTPEASAEAERRLLRRYPELRIVGRDCSFWSPDAEEPPSASPVVRAIRESGADLVVVALGSPKQEFWMARHERELAPAVAIGLGASIDFIAGTVRRAPAWMSNAGLEWLYRLAQEPRRLAYRYLVRDMQILPIFAGELLRKVMRRPSTRPASTAAGF